MRGYSADRVLDALSLPNVSGLGVAHGLKVRHPNLPTFRVPAASSLRATVEPCISCAALPRSSVSATFLAIPPTTGRRVFQRFEYSDGEATGRKGGGHHARGWIRSTITCLGRRTVLRALYRKVLPLWLLLSSAVLQIAGCAYLDTAKPLASDAGQSPSEVGTLTRADSAARVRVSQVYGKLPLSFEANYGQSAHEVEFLSRGPGYALFLAPPEAVLVLRRPASVNGSDGANAEATGNAVLRMQLVGANPTPLVFGQHELSGKVNYQHRSRRCSEMKFRWAISV